MDACLILLLARLIGQYCFACWRMSSIVVCNAAGGRAGRRTRGRWAAARPGAWAVRRPTLHGGPVRLRPVRATPCCIRFNYSAPSQEIGWEERHQMDQFCVG